MAAKRREEFLAALGSEKENGEFVAFIDMHNSREDFDMSEFIQGFPRKDYQQMWASIVVKVEQVVLSRAYLPESHRDTDTNEGDDDSSNSPALRFLRAVTQFAQIFLEVSVLLLYVSTYRALRSGSQAPSARGLA